MDISTDIDSILQKTRNIVDVTVEVSRIHKIHEAQSAQIEQLKSERDESNNRFNKLVIRYDQLENELKITQQKLKKHHEQRQPYIDALKETIRTLRIQNNELRTIGQKNDNE